MSNQGLAARMTLMPAQTRIAELEAENDRLRQIVESDDNGKAIAEYEWDRANKLAEENARLRGMLPQGVPGLSWVNPAPHAAAPAVVSLTTRTVQIRDCACCCDQPTVPPDCPACKGVGGFGMVAIVR
ncbi:hypothetical protein ACLBYG_22200 [Methylobacterium sp. D53M]